MTSSVSTTLAGYQKGFTDVTGQEITIQNGTTLMVYCHHPYVNTNDYFGFVLYYNSGMSVFTVSNTNADLPFTIDGDKLIFRTGYWIVKVAVISTSLN